MDAVNMRGIVKTFGGLAALSGVDLTVEKGAIHALLGENGAGKSTLMNVLYGVYEPDSGGIAINGKPTDVSTPAKAIAAGVGMVHQHFMLVENMTVAQNIILGAEVTSRFGVLDMKRAKADIDALSARYGLTVDPGAVISDISVGQQQRVEILKTLYRGSEILILDEPTAVLTPSEIQELAKIARRLAEDGKTVIIITHKLKEIKQMADVCTVIRRGAVVGTVSVADATEEELAAMMVGRAVTLHADKTAANPGETVLSIDGLTVRDSRGVLKLNGLSLSVRKGEILGIAGVDGNGQKELVEAITNLTKCERGTITVRGRQIQNKTPKYTIDSGVAAIHEDRHKRGLVLDFPVDLNCVLETHRRPPFARRAFLNFGKIAELARGLVKRYDVRPDNCEKLRARALSGGNQQKVIIARQVNGEPELLVAAQPTRGLDVGAIEFVHKALIARRDAGNAVLLLSFELDEILDLADTVAVLYDGKIVKTFPTGERPSEEAVGYLMAGGETSG